MTEEEIKKAAIMLAKTGFVTYKNKTYKSQTLNDDERLACHQCERVGLPWDDLCKICIRADEMMETYCNYLVEYNN